jgi:hypothetical protein
MKRLVISVIAIMLTGLAGFVISCDKIEAPYMNVVDVSDCPVPTFPDVTTPKKTVLIEEFTGHECVYCPAGSFYLHQIEGSFGDSVVVMAIHASGLAEPGPAPWDLDLRPLDNTGQILIGEDYYLDFQIPAEPRAMFNRKKFDGTNYSYGTPATWQDKVVQELSLPKEISMQMINDYDAAARKLCIHVKTKFFAPNSLNLKIAVFITEDSIVGYQLNNNATYGTTPEITDYVFMDVMREGLLGAYGEVLTSGSVAQDSAVIRTYKKILPATWVDKHCKVVAYVYDVDTKVVLQAVEGKVIE